jgi:hypothetical protein
MKVLPVLKRDDQGVGSFQLGVISENLLAILIHCSVQLKLRADVANGGEPVIHLAHTVFLEVQLVDRIGARCERRSELDNMQNSARRLERSDWHALTPTRLPALRPQNHLRSVIFLTL